MSNCVDHMKVVVSNFRNPNTDKTSSNEALIQLADLIKNGDLLSEVDMYVAGNVYDRFNLASGYERATYLVSQRFSDADKSWHAIAKELFNYYGVLVLGFTHLRFSEALKEFFTDEALNKLTSELVEVLKDRAEEFDLPAPSLGQSKSSVER